MSDVDVSPSTIGHMSHSCICIVCIGVTPTGFLASFLWAEMLQKHKLPVGSVSTATTCAMRIDLVHTMSYYVMLCHTISISYYFPIIYRSTKPSSTVFSPNRLVLHVLPWLDVVASTCSQTLVDKWDKLNRLDDRSTSAFWSNFSRFSILQSEDG